MIRSLKIIGLHG